MIVIRRIINRYWLIITCCFIIVSSLILSLQGFDLTDEGYCLVAYQNFFCDPKQAAYSYGFYLTGFIGGLWELIFGSGGWYSFRVLNTIVIALAYIITCHTLKEYWKYKWLIFAAFSVIVLNMANEHGTLVFHYYTFSAFANCLIAYLLYISFKEEKIWLVGLASLVLGISIFIRIPNIMLCVIPYILAIVNYLYNKQTKTFAKLSIVISLGIILGIGIVLLVILSLGHWDYFVESIFRLSTTAQDSTNNHGIVHMIQITCKNLKYICYYFLVYAMIFGSIRLYFKYVENKDFNNTVSNNIICVLCFCIVSVISYILYSKIIGPLTNRQTSIIAFSYVLLLFTIITKYKNKKIAYLILIFFLISNLQPLGSDGGIVNMGPYSIWGLLPCSAVVFMETIYKSYKGKAKVYSSVVWAFIFLSILYLGKNCVKQCYRDDGNRWDMTYRIQQLSLATVYTGRERAEEINNLLKECSKLFKEGDTVFFALDMPGMHYLTKTKPYLDNPWPMLKNNLKIPKERNGNHPVIVERKPFMISATTTRHISNTQTLHNYIKEKGYRLVWKSENYKIWI